MTRSHPRTTSIATVTIDYGYDADGAPITITVGGITYYYALNLQGDVVAIINSSGNAVVEYTYDAWGDILSATGSMATTLGQQNSLRYRGYAYDAETGLYHLQTRYYNPKIGRFVNSDSILVLTSNPTGSNLFVYCKNNPIIYVDSTGNIPIPVIISTAVCSDSINAGGGGGEYLYRSKSLPPKGNPNSTDSLYNPDGSLKQKRWYGPEGEPVRDRDFNHAGNMPFPHDHAWRNGNRDSERSPVDPSYQMVGNPFLGLGMIIGSGFAMVLVVGDNLTGVGAADDYLLEPLMSEFEKGVGFFLNIFK